MSGEQFLRGVIRDNQTYNRVMQHNTVNADQKDYHELKVVTEPNANSGSKIKDIQSKIEPFLQGELSTKNSEVAYAGVLKDNWQKIAKLFGSPDDLESNTDYSTALNNVIADFFSKLDTLEITPQDPLFKERLLTQVQETTKTISDIAKNLQNLRVQLDGEIAQDARKLTADLKSVHEQRKIMPVLKQDDKIKYYDAVNNLESTLSKISELIDIKRYYNQDGLLMLDTTSGITLLSDIRHEVDFEHTQDIKVYLNDQKFTPLSLRPIKNDGTKLDDRVDLVTGGKSDEIQHKISSGKLSALFHLRDKVIPQVLESLDQFVGTFTNKVNDVYRKNTVYTGYQELTGDRKIDLNANIYGTGNFKLAILDENGHQMKDTSGVNLPLINIDVDKINTNENQNNFTLEKFIEAANTKIEGGLKRVSIDNLYNVKLIQEKDQYPPAGSNDREISFGLDFINPSDKKAKIAVEDVTVTTLKNNAQVSNIYLTSTDLNLTGSKTNGNNKQTDILIVDAGKIINSIDDVGINLKLDNDDIKNNKIDELEVKIKIKVNDTDEEITYKVPLNKNQQKPKLDFSASAVKDKNRLIDTPLEKDTIQFVAVDKDGNEVDFSNPKSTDTYLKLRSLVGDYNFAVVEDTSNFDDNISSFIQNNNSKNNNGVLGFFEANNLFIHDKDNFYNRDINKNSAYTLHVNPAVQDKKEFAAARMEFTEVENQVVLDPKKNEKNAYEYLKNYTIIKDSKAGLDQLALLNSQYFSFNESTLLPAASTSFSQYVSSLMTEIASKTRDVTRLEENATIQCQAVVDKIQSKSGVSVDEQLLNLVDFNKIYQGCLKTYGVMREMEEKFMSTI